MEKKEQRQRKKSQIGSRRQTFEKQRRMKAIAEVAFNEDEDNTFGVNDDDWNIYLTMVILRLLVVRFSNSAKRQMKIQRVKTKQQN